MPSPPPPPHPAARVMQGYMEIACPRLKAHLIFSLVTQLYTVINYTKPHMVSTSQKLEVF
jgi:hypothetical protein